MPGPTEREKHRMSAQCLGNTIRSLRLRKGLSQEQVAHQADITVGSYGCIERGIAPSGQAANPTLRTLLLVFEVLQISAHMTSDSSTDDKLRRSSLGAWPVG